MERESFENPDVATLLNQHFINIKVDREERPDLDAIYMDAVQMLTGSGGWPMSVWLTPELKPFYAGTYFSPSDGYGRPGFPSIVTQLAEIWNKKRETVLESAQQVTAAMQEINKANQGTSNGFPSVESLFEEAFRTLEKLYDSVYGGFGSAPKFPMPVYHEFLLHYYYRSGEEKALTMVKSTLAKMAKGGLYDQLGGGFARYSTDAQWLVPHFEKMLYDNAQLIAVLVDVYRFTKDRFYAERAQHAISYILRDMTHSEGAFFSAEDADSEGKEGTFYLWTLQEIKEALSSQEANIFLFHYNVSLNGNFMDPHSEELGKNVLVEAHTEAETAQKFGLSIEELKKALASAKKILFERRTRRVRPFLDDKVLTSWNGLMISALCKAGLVLGEPSYIEVALKAVHFIHNHLYDKEDQALFRRWRDKDRGILAHQEDYAFLIQSLLDLYEATGETEWLLWASDLHNTHNRLFYDQNEGGYFMTVAAEDLLIRRKDERDNVIPSGNAIAVLNGFRLGDLVQNLDWIEKGKATVRAHGKGLQLYPLMYTKMLIALDFYERGHVQVVIAGKKDHPRTKQLMFEAAGAPILQKILIPLFSEKDNEILVRKNQGLKALAGPLGQPIAYVCMNFKCQAPTQDPEKLRNQLTQIHGQAT